jgi:hypothetical protein
LSEPVQLYTVEEAQAALPEIIPVLESIRAAYVELRALQASLSAEVRGASGDGHLLANPWQEGGKNRVEELNRELRRGAGELDRRGVELKDPEKGLIDFFHDHHGRVVYLCFQLGEARIQYFHELRAGFAGRQPLWET